MNNPQFYTFIENFPIVKVNVYEDSMIYKVPRGRADSVAKEANQLIEKLNLPLVAIPTILLAKDTVLIKNNETFDI